MSHRVVSLDTAAGARAADVGGKAARLAVMTRAGLRVPPAFALTVHAFAEFCRANGIDVSAGPAERVAALIRGALFPEPLARELREHLTALPGDVFAVRSSAPAEDGAMLSMAGQLDSFLGVAATDVAERVKQCWAALFGPAVSAYARMHGLPRPTAMGVVVQQQINPTYAGVLFSIDPVTGSADDYVVEWVRGLGDALVAGAVTPSRTYVSRRRGAAPAAVEPALAAALAELAGLAARVERDMECPVDIEWCAGEGGVFLLQARPITTAVSGDVWTATNMTENFPRPLAPLAWSVVDTFYTRYIQCLAETLGVTAPDLAAAGGPDRRLTGVMGGRVYYNIRSWYALLDAFAPGLARALRRGLDHYIGQQVPVAMPDAPPPSRRGVAARLAFGARLVRSLLHGRRSLERFERLFFAQRRRLRSAPYDAAPAADLVAKMDGLLDGFMARHWHRQGVADLAMVVFPGLVAALVERWVVRAPAAESVTAQLLRPGATKGTASVTLIAAMAEAIGADRRMLGLLRARRYVELEHSLPPALRALYGDFMERFGCRCYHECMIVTPTFEERPDLLWELVERYQRAGVTAARGAPTADPAGAVLKGLPFWRRMLLALAIRRARLAVEQREQGRLVQSLLFGEIHTIALALGRRLVALGHLAQAEDVFLLQLGELRDLCAGKFLFPETLPALVALRRDALVRSDASEPPECVMLPRGVYVRDGARPAVAAGNTLRGTGASSGRARGRVRVIQDPVRDKLEPGEILVARSTDPGWTALFAIAGALVLERGGMLSHGAIVAREFGVPAVVGVAGATAQLTDGALVCVDGDSGVVTLLDAAGEPALVAAAAA